MSTEANKAVIQRYYDEVWNGGNLDVLEEIMAPGLLHAPGAPQAGAQKAFIAAARAKFPDLHYTVSNMIAEGDLVAWVWESQATNPETGKRQTQAGMTMHRVRDGKMVERWMFARPSAVEEA